MAAVSSRSDAAPWLAGLPDPIPRILARRWLGRPAIAALLVTGVVLTAMFYEGRFDPPDGWLAVVGIWSALFLAAASAYAWSLGRRPPVTSVFDLLTSVGWRAAKWIVLINALYGIWYGWQYGAAGGVSHFVQRLLKLPDLLLWPGIDGVQIACLIALHRPVIEALNSIRRTRIFENQLAPREERRIEADIKRARRLIARHQHDEADALLDQARARLDGLLSRTRHPGLNYHRRLMREKIVSLRGGSVSQDFQGDPFGDAGAAGAPPPAQPSAPASAAQATNPASHSMGNDQYREYLESLREKADVSWADVAGLDGVVGEMKTAFAMALAEAPRGVKLDPPRRILLYGPPGTGKTLLTAAASNSFDAAFYNIKVSDVLSKFFGESTRLISALFELAAEHSPAILFFDEIEAISPSRDAGGMEGEEKRMVSALLAELDGLKSKGVQSQVFTIAATNIPWGLDGAILSRFEKQFHVPLPDEAARRRILEIHLADRGFQVNVKPEKLVQHTRGYSGRELRRLCQEAVRAMMDEANPGMAQAVDRGGGTLRNLKLKTRPIGVDHFNAAFRRVRPQTSPDVLRRYREWQNQL